MSARHRSGRKPRPQAAARLSGLACLCLAGLVQAQAADTFVEAGTTMPGISDPSPAAAAAPQAEAIDEVVSLDQAPPPVPSASAQPAEAPLLETVVVLAQKRAEAIQDVPISISVLDDQFIQDWSITDLSTAALYTPNVKMADAGYFIMPRIRGFGTDQNNKAFEPPAGVAVDGIPYTRLEYFNSAMFDLERMEVYRGPQGTAFGKNTTAGLIHLITKSPSASYQGYAEVQSGQFQRRRAEAAVGGPLLEGFLNFRLAGLYDQREGFVDNSAEQSLSGAPRHGRGVDRRGVRLKLDFLDLWGSELKLSLESVDSKSIGAGLETYDPSDALRQAILRYEPRSDFIRGNYVNTINDPDFRNIRIETLNADWRYQLGDWNLVALGGYSVLKDKAGLDVDATAVPAIFGGDQDRSPTTTAELRLESPDLDGLLGMGELFGVSLGHSNILGGLYYQRRDIQGDGIVFRFGLSYLDLLVAADATSPDNPLAGALDPLLAALYPLLPAPLGSTNSTYSEEVTQDFDQQAKAGAAFTQLQWHFTAEWGMEYGVRYNRESKDAQFNQYYSSPTAILMPVLGVNEYQAQRHLSESNLAQRVSLNFEPDRDLGLFLHWAKGFRGGGFNSFSYNGAPETLSFGPESAKDWGLDFKASLLGGNMHLNASLYRMTVNNFQVLVGEQSNTGIGLGTTRVQNAAAARAQGLEADMTWALTRWFTLFSTLGLNDSKYLDFADNACEPDNQNTDGDANPHCDASGKPFPLTPKLTAGTLGMVTLPLFGTGLGMQLGAGFDYQSWQYTDTALDSRFRQGGIMRWRATLGIGNPAQGWSLRLQGENLTDRVVSIRQAELIKGARVEGVDAPRTIYGSLRYDF